MKHMSWLTELLVFVFLLDMSPIHAQEKIFKKEISLKSVLKDREDVLPIIDDNRVMLFLMDRAAMHVVEIDEQFVEQNHYTLDHPKERSYGSFENLIGYSTTPDEYHLFYSKRKNDQFLIQSINLVSGKNITKSFRFDSEREKFFTSFHYQGDFFLFTLEKSSSILKVYEFHGANREVKKKLDLSEYSFSNDEYDNLYHNLRSSSIATQNTRQISDIFPIDGNIPVPLAISSRASKFFYFDNRAFITIDNEGFHTQIIMIDLETYEHSVRKIPYLTKGVCNGQLKTASNSFFFQDILFQVSCCKSAIAVNAIDLNSMEVLQAYSANSRQEIPFKNGSAIQNGGNSIYTMGTYKELVKTKQIFKRISVGDVGVSAFPSKDKVILKIGGLTEIQSPNPPPTFAPGSMSIVSVQTGSSRSVYFQSLLDAKSLSHIEGELNKDAFVRIKEFENKMRIAAHENELAWEDRIDLGPQTETIFSWGDDVIYGYYNSKQKAYILHKFTDQLSQ